MDANVYVFRARCMVNGSAGIIEFCFHCDLHCFFLLIRRKIIPAFWKSRIDWCWWKQSLIEPLHMHCAKNIDEYAGRYLVIFHQIDRSFRSFRIICSYSEKKGTVYGMFNLRKKRIEHRQATHFHFETFVIRFSLLLKCACSLWNICRCAEQVYEALLTHYWEI